MSGTNTVEVYQANTVYFLDFRRRLPMFLYGDKYVFVYNFQSTIPVYARLQTCIYIVMVNVEDPMDKRIVIYDLFQVNHNSLKNIIKLNPEHADSDNFFSAEKLPNFNSIFIYMFYDGIFYEFITYEPENYLVNLRMQNGSNVLSNGRFENVLVKYDMFPMKTEATQFMNDTIPLYIENQNLGLKIRKRFSREHLTFTNEDKFLRISLLDHFEGFNMSFKLLDEGKHSNLRSHLNYTFSKDTLQEYFLDAVNNRQTVKYSFQFKYNDVIHLIVLYAEDYWMQVFDLSNTITLVNPGMSYQQQLDGCRINFAKYVNVEAREENFLILNCLSNSIDFIGPKYNIKIFRFGITADHRLNCQKLTEWEYDRSLYDADIVNAPLQVQDYILVLHPYVHELVDSTLHVADLKCVNETT